MDDPPPGTVRSDYTVFAIIEGLRKLDGAGVTELATHLDLSKSSVHKHLKSLEELGFVDNFDGTYDLSLRLLEYGGYVRVRNRIYRFGRPKAEKLAEEVDELVMLSSRDGDRCPFLFRTSNRYGLQNVIPLGERPYLHQNAAGRAILAECSDTEIETYIEETSLPKAMEKTITDPEHLWDAIERIRNDGFAVSRGERFNGIQAISSAITDDYTGAIGAITIVAPEETAAGGLESAYAEDVVHTAKEISLELSYSEPVIGVP
jgi:DNA-binding IclR family transcriptional regulator